MWTSIKKVCGHKHHNKWLLYASTVILVINLLINVVESSSARFGVGSNGVEAHRLTAIENETTGKVRVKSGSVFGNAISNSGSRLEGKTGPVNSITSNELHSSFMPHAVDEETEDNSYQDEDDEDYSSYDDSFEEPDPKNGEMELIKDHEKHDGHHQRVIAKCCPIGHGLTVRGSCGKMKPEHLFHNEKFWFPEKAYDVDGHKMVQTNMSDWIVEIAHKLQCRSGERTEVVFNMHRFVFFKDGSLLVHEHNKLFKPLEFCFDHELGKGQGRLVQACFTKEQLCDDRQCLRKCCPKGSFTEERYSDAGLDWRCDHNPVLAETYNFNNSEVLSSTPHCSIGMRVETITGNYNISENGTLQTSDFVAPLLSYCLDYFVNKSSVGLDDKLPVPKLKALVCFDSPELEALDSKGLIILPQNVAVIFGVTMIISAICLAVAACISWRLPEIYGSLHGKCQLSHLATMFCLYLSLAIVQLGTRNIPQGLCTFFGVFIHICALSSFLWLNLLCVNIYLTFRSLRPPLAARRDENRRLVFLCIYAWGIPAAFCLFLYILDTTPDRLEPMPSPEYGQLKCLISNRQAEFAYLFGPVGVLLLCNGLLFCLTARELLCGVWRLDNSDSINFRRKSMGIVVAKLGIVMGMGWILDVLSWAIGAQSPYMFYAADLFNSFQGVLISVILLWRKRVLEVLHLRKPSMTKDETLTARPFLPKNGSVNIVSNGDHDTSLVIVNEQ